MENKKNNYGIKSDLWGFYYSVRILGLAIVSSFAGLYFGNIQVWLIVWTINTLLFMSYFSLLHWCVHNSLFKTKGLNKFFGRIFATLTLDLFSGYKYWHCVHHNLTETAVNQEQVCSDRIDEVSSLKTYFTMMLYYFLNPISKLSEYCFVLYADQKNREKFFTKNKNAFLVDFVIYFVFVCLLLFLLIVQTKTVLFVYLIPFALSLPTIFFFDIAEHHDTDPNGITMSEKTRSITGNWFTRFITSNANFHLEHHIYPTATPQEMLSVRNEIDSQIIFKEKTYFNYNLSLIGKYIYEKDQ